ncbi:MHYT domain-containing protein [Pararobbsia alpina]|uniref:MHYT domain-containing protein n=1 Tax=Pararobbsia alpina TaxID=621374 RepID=UPI0039A560F7
MTGTYDFGLVSLSFLLAVFASFTALNVSDRLDVIGNRPLGPWIVFGGCIMGLGIWSMHFVAMLAFHLPIAVGYNIPATIGSLLVAMIASAIGFMPLCTYELRWSRLIGGAVAMGLGVAGMHYLGMQAMDVCPPIQYSVWLVGLSIVIAVLASAGALVLAFGLRGQSSHRRMRQASSAVVMGIAVCGMHYCGMAAAHFDRGSYSIATLSTLPIPWLAGIVVTFSLVIFAASIAITVLDASSDARAREIADAILRERLGKHASAR